MDAGIEPPGVEIERAVVGADVEHDVGVLAGELTQPCRHHQRERRARHHQTQASGWPAALARNVIKRFFDVDEAGRRRPMSCCPASVVATLRVVRASRRTPRRSSRRRIAWLTAEVDTPRRFAARVKLRSSATARNASKTMRSTRAIHEYYSRALVLLSDFS